MKPLCRFRANSLLWYNLGNRDLAKYSCPKFFEGTPFMAHSAPYPTLKFADWQVWPGSYNNPGANGIFRFPPKTGLHITPSTPIASMGSCFAREIRKVLLDAGYNYIMIQD